MANSNIPEGNVLDLATFDPNPYTDEQHQRVLARACELRPLLTEKRRLPTEREAEFTEVVTFRPSFLT
ncbi:hypothetical protein MF271_08795 [Deinococcus sp. KNUC1210]|uniref:hypothetical protein n=1 Tax=Deinococcus sp. KNUC1210 TaxID=2917691 RepID=UPI001EF06460|nr:hypothetical protein [Deinococcus sp. KNUC1210]ULH16652.1 hypothetical protein MF271_08795 [Deinococcus sp. KNUC1210]